MDLGIRYRLARPKDREGVLELLKRCRGNNDSVVPIDNLEAHFELHLDWLREKRLPKLFQDPHKIRVHVAETTGEHPQIVGMASSRVHPDHKLFELAHIAVHPDFRNKRVNDGLIKVRDRLAVREGWKAAFVSEIPPEARRAYVELGYTHPQLHDPDYAKADLSLSRELPRRTLQTRD